MGIETNSQQVFPEGGHAVAIVESFEDEEPVQLISSTEKNGDGRSKTKPPTCKVAKVETIPPRSEAAMMARTVHEGILMVEAIPNTSDENRLRLARSIKETPPNQLFHIMIVNTSNVSVTLRKNMKLTQLTAAPSTIVPKRKVSGVDSVNAMPIYKGSQDRERQFAQH